MTERTDLQEIELSIEAAKKNVELMESLHKLLDDPDFQKVILEGYLKDEAVRLTWLKGDPNMKSAEQQEGIEVGLRSIGELQGHFRKLEFIGLNSQAAILDAQNMQREILEEEDEGI